ncbi:MFS transporter [Burkholderia sp. Bp9031]|uniref:MFS transporter n=1 Tax=Burkholderia sp. Bp9031 TaxID=2184566 RepID=UPI0021AB7B24|nr:MFS transporter [Burkholderia sp. Bp9031]
MSTTLRKAGTLTAGVDFEDRVYARLTRRLVPFLCLCYLCAYLDRINVGFAKLQMTTELNWSDTVYGLGAGVFFLGYVLVEVPSNLLLQRVGARRWIARIMIMWALISGLTAFVRTPGAFYLMRFLLGVAEAGFLPGIVLYLSHWYPANRRATATALFYCAIPLSGVFGGPLSGWILNSLHGSLGMSGWQWVLVLEAVPSLLLGAAVLMYLPDDINEAKWLSEEEKAILSRNIGRESSGKAAHSLGDALRDRRVWLMGLIFFSCAMGNYGLSFWLPSLIQAAGVRDPLNIGLLIAIPFGAGTISMVLWSRHSDKRRERRWHLAGAMIMGAAGLVLAGVFGTQIQFALVALTLASIGIQAMAPVFWSMPTAFLTGTAAAAGIALITSIANLAGFISPYLIGWIKDTTHSANMGLYLIAATMFGGAVIMVAGVPAKLVNR